MGVATVAVLFLAVRRSFGTVAATIAGAVMALTPAAVLIFRYDNPNTLLTLLLVSAAWALLRAPDAGRVRWLALAGTLGLGFPSANFLQAWLVLPVFALVWVVAAPGGWRRRMRRPPGHQRPPWPWPASPGRSRSSWCPPPPGRTSAGAPATRSSISSSATTASPVLGGAGNSEGGDPSGGGGMGFGGAAGILRMFNSEFGGQVAYQAVPVRADRARRRARGPRPRAGRTDRRLVGYLLWGGWLVVQVLVFSFMSGTIHSYYTVVLAPAIGALVGAGTVELWRLRARSPIGGFVLAGAFVASGAWAWALLERTPDFAPGLGIAVFAITVAAAVVVALPAGRLSGRRTHLAGVAVAVALAALLAGPAVFAAQTMATAHSGGDPAAGPSSGSGFGGGPGGQAPSDGAAAGIPGGTTGSTLPGGTPPDGGPTAGGTGAGAAGGGGMGGAADEALTTYLTENAGSARWIVAVSGSGSAAAIQLATGLPVMAMGGFNGSDAAPTLEQLQAYVASGELRYVLLGSGGGVGSGGASTSGRDSWVTSTCTVVDTGSPSGTLYDCADATGG